MLCCFVVLLAGCIKEHDAATTNFVATTTKHVSNHPGNPRQHSHVIIVQCNYPNHLSTLTRTLMINSESRRKDSATKHVRHVHPTGIISWKSATNRLRMEEWCPPKPVTNTGRTRSGPFQSENLRSITASRFHIRSRALLSPRSLGRLHNST